jgi:sortase (surface protein transpeptidase)
MTCTPPGTSLKRLIVNAVLVEVDWLVNIII